MVTRVHSLKLEKKTIPVGAECLCHKLRKYEDIKRVQKTKIERERDFFCLFFLKDKIELKVKQFNKCRNSRMRSGNRGHCVAAICHFDMRWI